MNKLLRLISFVGITFALSTMALTATEPIPFSHVSAEQGEKCSKCPSQTVPKCQDENCTIVDCNGTACPLEKCVDENCTVPDCKGEKCSKEQMAKCLDKNCTMPDSKGAKCKFEMKNSKHCKSKDENSTMKCGGDMKCGANMKCGGGK